MGTTAENIAERWGFTREAQDAFSARSSAKAEEAIRGERFRDEIVPVTVPAKKEPITFDQDEFPRFGTTESLARLRPAFSKDGTITAGNASGINDGAAAVVLMPSSLAEQKGSSPARIKSFAVSRG